MKSQYGWKPLGTSGPFSSPGKISILGVLVAAENRVIMVWDLPPNARDVAGLRSATNAKNYSISALDPTIVTDKGNFVPPGELVPTYQVWVMRARVDDDDPAQIHLWTDRPLERGRRYEVAIHGLIDGANCEELDGPITWGFKAPKPPTRRAENPVLTSPLQDLDDGLILGEGSGRVWRYQAGDVALQSSAQAFEKRIVRLLSTRLGEYTYDPQFGFSIRLSETLRPAMIQSACIEARRVLLADPAVKAASVQASTRQLTGGAAVVYSIDVLLHDGRRNSFLVPVTES